MQLHSSSLPLKWIALGSANQHQAPLSVTLPSWFVGKPSVDEKVPDTLSVFFWTDIKIRNVTRVVTSVKSKSFTFGNRRDIKTEHLTLRDLYCITFCAVSEVILKGNVVFCCAFKYTAVALTVEKFAYVCIANWTKTCEPLKKIELLSEKITSCWAIVKFSYFCSLGSTLNWLLAAKPFPAKVHLFMIILVLRPPSAS